MREAIKGFLDWLQTHDNVWFVTNQQVRCGSFRLTTRCPASTSADPPRSFGWQLLDWMRDPVSNADIASSTALQCAVPDVPADLKICNGIEQNEVGLLNQCPFAEFPWWVISHEGRRGRDERKLTRRSCYTQIGPPATAALRRLPRPTTPPRRRTRASVA